MVLVMLPLAAMATGESRFHGIGNLRLKECDRISVPVRELGRLGVDCEEKEDEIIVRGCPSGYEGGIEIGTHDDHRVAQMLTIMGLRCRQGLVLNEAETVVAEAKDHDHHHGRCPLRSMVWNSMGSISMCTVLHHWQADRRGPSLVVFAFLASTTVMWT